MSRQPVATGTTVAQTIAADPLAPPRLPPAGREAALIPTPVGTVTRRAAAGDLDAVQDLHGRCSIASRAARYMAGKRELTWADWRHFTHPTKATTWLTSPADAPDRIVAMTNLVAHRADPSALDLGLLIEDGFQDQGLGTALARLALSHAKHRGCQRLTASTEADNRRMLAILRRLGATGWQCSGWEMDAHVLLDGSR
ncbi:RimJ/RimL family protein N-acetyltransferase [Streptacidiphilus sp. MAP12-20]|uniref:GNAT family N-acetyltransferase n=1 Tax=Streptacidiphilus sp. MAP12-20 TaxID=3156299 RepID=UPI003513124B